jgi:hypothetical protein
MKKNRWGVSKTFLKFSARDEVDGEIRFKSDNIDSMRRIRLHCQQ